MAISASTLVHESTTAFLARSDTTVYSFFYRSLFGSFWVSLGQATMARNVADNRTRSRPGQSPQPVPQFRAPSSTSVYVPYIIYSMLGLFASPSRRLKLHGTLFLFFDTLGLSRPPVPPVLQGARCNIGTLVVTPISSRPSSQNTDGIQI